MEAHQRNLTATLRLLELTAEIGAKRFVFASSAAVYGDPEEIPVSEGHRAAPKSPYGLQKLASEQYGRLIGQSLGFEFVGLRLFNVFGPRQLPNSPYSGVISRFFSAIANDCALTIHGDGSQTRDFVYVKDVAAAFLAALTIPLCDPWLICNIGSGEATSISALAQLVHAIASRSERRLRIETGPSSPGDIRHSRAAIRLARDRLGFQPTYNLRAGLEASSPDPIPFTH